MPETTSRPPEPARRQRASRASRSRWWAVAALSLSLLVVGLDTYVLNTALPTLSAKLGASTSQLQWITDPADRGRPRRRGGWLSYRRYITIGKRWSSLKQKVMEK